MLFPGARKRFRSAKAKDNDGNGLTDCADPGCADFCSLGGTNTLKVHLAGAFVFDDVGPGGVKVFLNQKGNTATSDTDVEMTRPTDGGGLFSCSTLASGGSLADTWDEVFCGCVALVNQPPGGFFVGHDGWHLNINTTEVQNISVVFANVRFLPPVSFPDTPVRITLGLSGDLDLNIVNFPPSPLETIVIPLTRSALLGKTEKGIHPRSGCFPRGGGSFSVVDLFPPSLLTICGENVANCPPPPPP